MAVPARARTCRRERVTCSINQDAKEALMMLILYTLLLSPLVGLCLRRVARRQLVRIEHPTLKGALS